MPPKVAGAGKKKKRSGKRKAPKKGRGIFGSLGGLVGGLVDMGVGGLGKKRRGRGMDLSNLSPVTMGKPPGFIQA